MEFELPEEHRAFRDMVRRWVDNECPKDWARKLDGFRGEAFEVPRARGLAALASLETGAWQTLPSDSFAKRD